MKLKNKALYIALSVIMAAVLLTGCSGERTPYDINDEESYNVSVRYDANGGSFTTNTSVIVDSYNLADVEKNSKGEAEIALIAPEDKNRGNDAFMAVKNGYFLAGWYENRTEIKDDNGETAYTYSDKWDFEKDLLEVDSSKQYSSKEPVLTLYAAWVSLFEIEFYSLDSGEYMDSFTFNPNEVKELQVPDWDEKTGALEMYHFPERSGYTFTKAYFDEDATEPLESNVLKHTGAVDYETATATDHKMKLYVEWREGEWYHIYNTKQFLENASVKGNYEIYADLDFEGEVWPTSLMYGNFSGEINGNGHTFKNIKSTQTNNSKVNAGLFGNLTDTAKISDITFENVSFTIKSGTRVVGTSYGLLAGTLSQASTLSKVQILSSKLQIDSSCYFGVEDYSIGLVCGMGNANAVEKADIECVAVGNDPEALKITVNGNTVTVDNKDE